ncbi:response regulator [Zunongwangia sp. F363]|uniref:Response regulator n=1 Tax=Autumnicola tepida TaxID=3075595 RepID=A0ABU3CF03_9FLAO|nr:response regulator [Zunongwangia sp. F363]MDT0644928.1 response regulator [Zunongwangia sp. F363]
MNKKLKILLIEDDIIEIMKVHRTMHELSLDHQITESKNGEEALEFLHDKSLELPDLIFVDLHMPKMNGFEFLEIFKNNPSLKHIPAIVFTTSANQNDLKESYKIGIAGYIIKPLKYEDYVLKLKSVLEYWSSNELIKS